MARRKHQKYDTRALAVAEEIRDHFGDFITSEDILGWGPRNEEDLRIIGIKEPTPNVKDGRSWTLHMRAIDYNGERDYTITVREGKDGQGADTRSV
jgi:hypothetical protein